MSDPKLDAPEDELEKDLNFELPNTIRWLINIPIILLIFSILSVYGYLLLYNPNYIEIEKYGFPTTLSVLIITLIVINIPWNKMGFRIKKIGMIELENVVTVQARGNARELADLQKQIDELKSQSTANKDEMNKDKKLDELVKKFLGKYNRWAFSALRIKKWGVKQRGFENFKDPETQKIRESLRRLLSNNEVVTRISSKGNTIYKINDGKKA